MDEKSEIFCQHRQRESASELCGVCVCGLPADVCVLQEHLYTIHLILRRFFSGLECFLACFSKYLAMFQLVKTSERAGGL